MSWYYLDAMQGWLLICICKGSKTQQPHICWQLLHFTPGLAFIATGLITWSAMAPQAGTFPPSILWQYRQDLRQGGYEDDRGWRLFHVAGLWFGVYKNGIPSSSGFCCICLALQGSVQYPVITGRLLHSFRTGSHLSLSIRMRARHAFTAPSLQIWLGKVYTC